MLFYYFSRYNFAIFWAGNEEKHKNNITVNRSNILYKKTRRKWQDCLHFHNDVAIVNCTSSDSVKMSFEENFENGFKLI